MKRAGIVIGLLFLAAVTAFAETPAPLVADGIVASVDGAARRYTVGGGRIIIDASGAVVRDFDGTVATFDIVRPSLEVSAVIESRTYAPNEPLTALSLQVVRRPSDILNGTIDSIDLDASTITVLGQIIHVGPDTGIGGEVASLDPKSLSELRVGESVRVTLDGNPAQLTAFRIQVIAPRAATVVSFLGTLVSYENQIFRLEGAPYNTVYVTSATSLAVTTFRTGMKLMFIARIDDGVATALVVTQTPPEPTIPPIRIFSFRGPLLERSADSIVVNDGSQRLRFTVTAATQFVGDPKVGDLVQVDFQAANPPVAITVTKLNQSTSIVFTGPIVAINGSDWTIGAFHVVVNAQTMITGDPKVGDRVLVLGKRDANDVITATAIQKQ
jgi:hypothetical protein